jgi:hypothetical protein
MKTKWQIGDVYYQAQIFRHGRGLDYDNPPCETDAEAEADLQASLGMMSEREREQSAVESHVRKYRVLAVESNGSVGSAETISASEGTKP